MELDNFDGSDYIYILVIIEESYIFKVFDCEFVIDMILLLFIICILILFSVLSVISLCRLFCFVKKLVYLDDYVIL